MLKYIQRYVQILESLHKLIHQRRAIVIRINNNCKNKTGVELSYFVGTKYSKIAKEKYAPPPPHIYIDICTCLSKNLLFVFYAKLYSLALTAGNQTTSILCTGFLLYLELSVPLCVCVLTFIIISHTFINTSNLLTA